MNFTCHPTAIVEAGAVVGANSIIGPYCHVGAHVTIGADCRLLSYVSISGDTHIGSGNEFFPFSSIGGRTEDLKYVSGTRPGLKIGDGNVFREGCTVNCATQEGHVTVIGNFGTFLSDSHVAHDCIIGDHVILGSGAKLAGHVEMGDYCTVNGMTGVVQFVRLGQYSFIGATNKVVKDVLPFMVADGNPSVGRIVNTVGLGRKGFDEDRIRRIKTLIRAVLGNKNSVAGMADVLRNDFADDPDARGLIAFIQASRLGIAL
jgi:UDP-N-acetylglucosamine acyltransferase